MNANVRGSRGPLTHFLRRMLLTGSLLIILAGCVNQHPNRVANDGESEAESSVEERARGCQDFLPEEEPGESEMVEEAGRRVRQLGRPVRLIATSPATADICDKLNLELVGVCHSTVSTIPERYAQAERIGSPMSPDLELIAALKPDWILSPAALRGDLQPKYEALGVDWAFLNLQSVPGMYRSIDQLGRIFGREEEARELIDEFQAFYKAYRVKNEGKRRPKVLILMGLPGSYIIATEQSYVGSLVAMAGGENVYKDADRQFLNVNTEDMKLREPDIILRAAHALPDQVIEMFRKDFLENDIWKHFDAVKNGRVYDLSYAHFGMSAKFNYPEALEELQPILYPENPEDEKRAIENSNKAGSEAEKSNGTQKYEQLLRP
ncbi:MAG: heme ABC transporter substrate-binding protein IsdE [Ndongobacter sp.]|nr:heme ABC transporter substrate-binding protein IsdE [Ndongobacter sp.]